MQWDDVIDPDYGTPSEIQRIALLEASANISKDKATAMVQVARFRREAAFLTKARASGLSVMFLQELDSQNNAEAPDSLLNYWNPEKGPWKIACNHFAGASRMLIINTNVIKSIKNPQEHSSFSGCSVDVKFPGAHQSTRLVVAHVPAFKIRRPENMNATLLAIAASLPKDESPAIVAGDFNADLYDIVNRIRILEPRYKWDVVTARNTSGPDGDWHFTSQAEFNFIASYDGYLVRSGGSVLLSLFIILHPF
jgi:endonuclease/exonuclease/phosphatase family metal-dependent hydrolase